MGQKQISGLYLDLVFIVSMKYFKIDNCEADYKLHLQMRAKCPFVFLQSQAYPWSVWVPENIWGEWGCQ